MRGKIKKFFDDIYKWCNKSFKKYISTNILFLSFIIISLLVEMTLRYVTVGNNYVFNIKPFLSDLMIILLIGSFGYLFKPKYQFRYFFTWLLFGTCLCIGNTIYYEFFKSFLSVNLISTASMIGEVNDALFDKLHFYQFLFLIYPCILIFIHKKLSKKNYYFEVEKIEKGKKMFAYTGASATIIAIILFCTLNGTEISRFVKQWNREYIVQRFGLYTYTINDMIQSVQPKLDTLFGYDESARAFREYYSCEWEKEKENNKYTGTFKGKNVIFIHMESIQNFLVNLTINGEEVTPNINRLTREGMYFSKFYPQISIGTSSDTEFSLLTGLMPSSSGTVFVNYYDRDYSAMPEYFNNLGYYTFSMHANNADYWNRKLMHKNLGYQDFYAKSLLEIPSEDDPEYIGLGLSDKSFFTQIQPILKDIKAKNKPYFGTIITLTNHSPFNDIEKYGGFKVTMDYSYTDEETGQVVNDTAKYLDGSSMGNYMQSAHYADEALGELFNHLRENNLLENTVFVLYGDHEARLAKSQFNLLYNYDPVNDTTIDSDVEGYYDLDNYNYDLLKNTPLIIWSADKQFKLNVTDVMGMYDILPTIGNMFGFDPKFALGNDIFSNSEKIVVFPNGNVLTNKVYYNSVNDNYIAFTNEVIESDYIQKLNNYATKALDISNGIILHDLIKNESERIGECVHEEE